MRRQETVSLGLQSDPEEEVCHLSSKTLCGRIQFQVCFWVLETISLHVLLAVNRPVRGYRHFSDNQGSGETFMFTMVSTQLVGCSGPAQLNKTKMAKLPAVGGSLSHGDFQRLTREGFYPLTNESPSHVVAEVAATLASQGPNVVALDGAGQKTRALER